MKRVIAFTGVLVAITIRQIAAQGALDQSTGVGGANAYIVQSQQSLAQSFQPSAAGYLTGVSVELARNPLRGGSVGVLICRLNDGIPFEVGQGPPSEIGPALFSTSIPMETIPAAYAQVPVPFGGNAVPLTANTSYAIVLTYPGSDVIGGIDPVAWRHAANE